jgi:hypothetical protein
VSLPKGRLTRVVTRAASSLLGDGVFVFSLEE